MAPGQGARALAASIKRKDATAQAQDKLKQQNKKDAQEKAKAASRRTKEAVERGEGLVYEKIEEIDPNLVSGRVTRQVERPKMKPLINREYNTDDESSDEEGLKGEQEEPRGQSTHGSNLLQSAHSAAAEEFDPHPPRGGNGSSEQVAKCS